MGDLIVGDYDGYVHIIDGETGAIINRMKTGDDYMFHSPLVVGDIFYTYHYGGELTALQFIQ